MILLDQLASTRFSCAGFNRSAETKWRSPGTPAATAAAAACRTCSSSSWISTLPWRGDPLANLETQRSFDQRLVLFEEKIIGFRTVDAADLIDVAKALGDQQRAAGAFALEDGVDGDRGTVEQEPSRVE